MFITVTNTDFKTVFALIFQEMEAEYTRSVKQSILDYVLLDPAEQRRLGLHMPLPVSLVYFFVILSFQHLHFVPDLLCTVQATKFTFRAKLEIGC